MKRMLAFLLCAILMLSCLPILSAGAKDIGVETKFRMLLEDMELVQNVHRSDRYFFEQIGQYPAKDPEWVLIRGGLYDLSANGDIQYQYAAFGNKFLRANTNSSPFSLGYGVFDVKTNVFYDLVDAWDMNLNNLREVWDELAPAVPYDEKDKSSENGMYVIGDADVDGEVTILDATRIQRCLAELDTNPWESFTATGADFVRGTVVAGATDYDRDGDTTVMDATRIQRSIADLPSVLTYQVKWSERSTTPDYFKYREKYLVTDRSQLHKDYPDEKRMLDDFDDSFFEDHMLVGVNLVDHMEKYITTLSGVSLDTTGTLNIDFRCKPASTVPSVDMHYSVCLELSKAFLDDIKDIKVNIESVEESVSSPVYTEIPDKSAQMTIPDTPANQGYRVLNTTSIPISAPNIYTLNLSSSPLKGFSSGKSYVMILRSRAGLESLLPGFDTEGKYNDAYFKDHAIVGMIAHDDGDDGHAEIGVTASKDNSLYVQASVVDPDYGGTIPTMYPIITPVWTFVQVQKSDVAQVRDIKLWHGNANNTGTIYTEITPASERKTVTQVLSAASDHSFISAVDLESVNGSANAIGTLGDCTLGRDSLMLIKSKQELNRLFPGLKTAENYDEAFFKDYAIVAVYGIGSDTNYEARISDIAVVDGNTLYADARVFDPTPYLLAGETTPPVWTFKKVKQSEIKNVDTLRCWNSDSVVDTIVPEDKRVTKAYIEEWWDPSGKELDTTQLTVSSPSKYDVSWQSFGLAQTDSGWVLLIRNRRDFERYLPGFDKEKKYDDDFFSGNAIIATLCQGFEDDAEARNNNIGLIHNILLVNPTVYYPPKYDENGVPYEEPTAPICWTFCSVRQSDVKNVSVINCWKHDDAKKDYEYVVNADGNIEITKYIGFGENISVPASIDGKKVVAIGNSAFEGKSVKNVTIPESVTSIGSYAFRKCRNLEKISMSDKVTSIGAYAFYACDALESFTVPAGVTQIYIGTFSYCPALKSVMMSDNVTYIGKEAFISCRSMERIYISNSVKTIGESAFERCTSLKSLSIPRGVKTISAKIAKNCTALEKVYIATEGYPTDVGIVIPPILNETIGESAFEGCTALTAVTMPVGIKTIGSRAFYGCTALEFIDLPSTITDINDNTFMNCEGLITVRQMGGDLTVKNVYENAFRGCKSLKNIGFTNALSSIGKSAFRDCSALTALDLKENLKNISSYAFFSCNALKKLTIPKSVTTIYQYSLGYTVDGNNAAVRRSDFTVRGYFGTQAAFYASYYGFDFEPIIEDTELAFTWLDDYSPDIPFGSEEPLGCHITNQAQRTEAIDQLYTVNGEVISRGDKTFAAENFNIYGYKDLIALRVFKGGSNELVMPEKVTITGENELTVDVKRWRSGGEEATPDMRWALQFISIPKLGERYTVKVNVRNDDTYKNYNGFEYDILTDDETGQKYVELLNYRGLEETVIVPDRIERLPVISTAHQLFRGNKIIKKVTMPAGMTTLGSRAFMGCTSLDTVTLPASLQRLEESTFEGCTALRYVYFGDESGESSQTTVIDANAFLNCTGIFEINLPAKLTAVMNNAFLGCTNLRVSADSNTNGVTLPRTIETISYKSFGYDKDGNKIESFYIYGYSDTAAERYAANNGFSFRKKDNAGPIDFTVDEIYALPEGTQFFGGSQNDCLVTNKADLKQVLDMAFTGVPEAVRDENSHRFKAEDYDDEWYKTHDVIVLHLSTKYVVNQPDISSLVRDESDRLVPTVIWHENGHGTRHDFIAILVVDKMDQYFDVSVKTIRDTVSA